ncbi:MAG: glycosyltransferase [Herpetosiphon sp.]
MSSIGEHDSLPLCYIAYPTSLTLQSANALQTWTTLRELRRRAPRTLALIPRSRGAESRFREVGAVHLPRPAIGRLSRLYRTTLLYYLEHSLFAWMCLGFLLWERLQGRRYGAIYVRQTVIAAWWAGVLGRIYGAPVIYEAHDWESSNPSRAKERWAIGLLHLMDRVALTQGQAVVSLTQHFVRRLTADGWIPAKVAVIPDAWDASIYQPQKQASARQQLGFAPEELLLVYAGMTFSYRGLDRLLTAFARANVQGCRLILVGGRPAEVAALQRQATELAITERVVFAGVHPSPTVALYLAAADVLVIPDTVTDVTASPLKLFEYMAMGRAIICVDLPALREVIDEQAARFVARGSVDDLARAVAELAADTARRATMGTAAHEQAQNWTYEQRAARILDVVQQVTQRQSA